MAHSLLRLPFQSVASLTGRTLSAAAFAALAGCSVSPDASSAPDQYELNTLWLSGQCTMIADAADALRSRDPGKRIAAPEAVDEVFVMRGETHWTGFWESVNSSMIDPPAKPPVDFEKHSLVAVVLKQQSRAGGGVELADSAAATAGDGPVEIPVSIRTPQSGGMSAAVVTRPCLVIQTYPALPDDTAVSIVSDPAVE